MLSYAREYHQGRASLSLTPTLKNQAWHITGTERAEYIEALSFSAEDDSAARDVANFCRYGTLEDDEILNWVRQSGDYLPLKSQDTRDTLRGGVRLLVLERSYYQPPSFHIKKETYTTIEKHFNLPENTLLALSDECGMSTHTLDVDQETGAIQRLGMIIKAPQKFQVGNYGLAFSHDFTTGLSTGIFHGTGVTQHGRDYDLWTNHAAAEIFEHIKIAHRFWNHPVFLATMLFQHHLLRADYFCTVILPNQLMDVEHQLGTTRTGRLSGHEANFIATELPVQQAKINLRELTTAMSNLIHEAIGFCSVSEWHCSCLKLLNEILTEIEGLNSGSQEMKSMRVRIQHLISSAESIKRNNHVIQEKGQTDMNVLYSIISQVDNRLSAKMAAASSRDSAAMKTLAFLTTLFLPGTSIATIFSTGMFNWQGSSGGSGDGKVVSKLFWVYWAFTVPLTIVVAVGWRLWWSWEKKQFDEDVSAEVKAIDGGSETTNGEIDAPQGGDGASYYSINVPSRIHLGARTKTGNYVKDMKSAVKRRVGVKKVERNVWYSAPPSV